MENLRKMFMAMAKDIRVILIKLADRLHNMRTIEYVSIKKQKDKAFETIEIYAPIAHRLGIQKIKWELEDLSLKYLDPIDYNKIKNKLENDSKNRQLLLKCIMNNINTTLKKNNINFQIQNRIKNFYSIYRKIAYQKKIIDQIYDICAIRIIVNNVNECYNVLGIVHDLYKNIPGRFKDYISTPKSNNYQSLHTTVISKTGISFEVQIRTQSMHETAEYGVAAHWKYKKNIDNTRLIDDKNFNWIRRLLESQENTQISDFLRTLKIELFADDVFVFTPDGNVINLPNGATPIDFAYEIHSNMGNNIIGCKINNINCNITNILKNGDVVEILISSTSLGPSQEWLNFVKTSEAKNKIKQFLKKKNRILNINNGLMIFEKNLINHNLYDIFINNSAMKKNLLNMFSLNSQDELYISISFGIIKINKVINKIKTDLFNNI